MPNDKNKPLFDFQEIFRRNMQNAVDNLVDQFADKEPPTNEAVETDESESANESDYEPLSPEARKRVWDVFLNDVLPEIDSNQATIRRSDSPSDDSSLSDDDGLNLLDDGD